jgi:hypothetical protein
MVIHRTPTLTIDETTRQYGIPVRTPDRTIFDLAPVLPRRQLERAIDEAERLRLCGPDELEAIVDVPIFDYIVDFLWRDARLIVEVDGHASHGTRRAFQQIGTVTGGGSWRATG